MKRFVIVISVLVLAGGAQASWYWPFGSDEGSSKELRVSELMEPASLLIDEASDLAAEGKTDESVKKYREALEEIDRIEFENPDRVKAPEFATLRNKRAYVNAAIDSMLLSQVKENAKPVAVSDTTELEQKLAEERAKKAAAKEQELAEKKSGGKEPKKDEPESVEQESTIDLAADPPSAPVKPQTKRDQAVDAIARGDYTTAERLIKEMLAAKPKSALALNLRSVMEVKQGRLKDAEATLDEAMMSNPKSHFAYYNMAWLTLKKHPESKVVARRYYETGRSVGGPEDPGLESVLKQ